LELSKLAGDSKLSTSQDFAAFAAESKPEQPRLSSCLRAQNKASIILVGKVGIRGTRGNFGKFRPKISPALAIDHDYFRATWKR
jgi:hypothetical protein